MHIKKPIPKKTMIGHNISPKQTPIISDNADFGPPEIVRATIAIHTGPGVINKIIKATI